MIFATFVELAQSGELQRHVLVTSLRVAAGFGIGVVAGTLAGAATGYSTLLRQLLDPTLQALRAIPVVYSFDDHLPQRYVSGLTPRGVQNEFGD